MPLGEPVEPGVHGHPGLWGGGAPWHCEVPEHVLGRRLEPLWCGAGMGEVCCQSLESCGECDVGKSWRNVFSEGRLMRWSAWQVLLDWHCDASVGPEPTAWRALSSPAD